MAVDEQPATLFLDTEWADDDGRELVSLALVQGGPYGQFTGAKAAPFYAERDPLPRPNAYARGIVYPLLDRGTFAHTDTAFSCALHAYLADARHPHTRAAPIIIATHANDFVLLAAMLAVTGPGPDYRTELRYSESLLDLIRTAFARSPELSSRRHHALTDAQVLQSVFARWSRIGRAD